MAARYPSACTPTLTHLLPSKASVKGNYPLRYPLTHRHLQQQCVYTSQSPATFSSAEAKCVLGLFHHPPERRRSLAGPFLTQHGCTASSRSMAEGESRCSWMVDEYKPSSRSMSTSGYRGQRSDKSSMRVNVRPNASVNPLAFLGFPFVDFDQPRDRRDSSLSMT